MLRSGWHTIVCRSNLKRSRDSYGSPAAWVTIAEELKHNKHLLKARGQRPSSFLNMTDLSVETVVAKAAAVCWHTACFLQVYISWATCMSRFSHSYHTRNSGGFSLALLTAESKNEEVLLTCKLDSSFGDSCPWAWNPISTGEGLVAHSQSYCLTLSVSEPNCSLHYGLAKLVRACQCTKGLQLALNACLLSFCACCISFKINVSSHDISFVSIHISHGLNIL